VSSSEEFFFRGVETGPYGESEFDVLGISTDADDFSHFRGHSYLLFTKGTFRPTTVSPTTGVRVFPERPRGAAGLFVPRDLRAGGTDHQSVLECQGLRGSERTIIRVTSHPTPQSPETPFVFDIDSGEQFHRYNWYGRDELHLDWESGCMRSNNRILLRIRTELG
jgi:hypothetical protein